MTRKAPEQNCYDAVDAAACTCANLRKATRVITQFYDAALQPTGLRATQFSLLATLSTLGVVPLSRLADALVMDRTTLTRNLKPLVEKGYIHGSGSDDQRVRMIALTPGGEKILKSAHPHWRKAQSQMVQGLGKDDWSGLLENLTAVISLVQSK